MDIRVDFINKNTGEIPTYEELDREICALLKRKPSGTHWCHLDRRNTWYNSILPWLILYTPEELYQMCESLYGDQTKAFKRNFKRVLLILAKNYSVDVIRCK